MSHDLKLYKRIYEEYLEPILYQEIGQHLEIRYCLHSHQHGTIHIYSDIDFLLLKIDDMDLSGEAATRSYFRSKLEELDHG